MISIAGKSKTQALATLELCETGAPIADHHEMFSAVQIDEWYVIWVNDLNFGADDATLARLSEGCRVLRAAFEEHVMWTQAVLWENGRCIWRIEHSGEMGVDPRNLIAEGQLPPEYYAIRNERVKLQEAEGRKPRVDHLFDITVELGFQICGYRYDGDGPDWIEPDFTTLKDLRPPRRSWLQRLLGR